MKVDLYGVLILGGFFIPMFILFAYFYYDQKRLDEIRNKKKKPS